MPYEFSVLMKILSLCYTLGKNIVTEKIGLTAKKIMNDK